MAIPTGLFSVSTHPLTHSFNHSIHSFTHSFTKILARKQENVKVSELKLPGLESSSSTY